MDPATIKLLVTLLAQLLPHLKRELDLAAAEGRITPEQLAEIRVQAALADARWDQLVKDLPPRNPAPGTPAPAPGTT